MPKNDCHFCTLFLCADNLNRVEKEREKYRRMCIIQILASKKPIECEIHCKIRNNSQEWEEKYEKLMHELQIAEKNLPCFHLGKNRCNRMGS